MTVSAASACVAQSSATPRMSMDGDLFTNELDKIKWLLS